MIDASLFSYREWNFVRSWSLTSFINIYQFNDYGGWGWNYCLLCRNGNKQ